MYRIILFLDNLTRYVGLSVWPASILLGQWVARRFGATSGVDMSQKMVLELGAGCGLPALVAGENKMNTQFCGLCNYHTAVLVQSEVSLSLR